MSKVDPTGEVAIAIGFAVVAVGALALLALNAAVQTGIYLQKNPININLAWQTPAQWGTTFERREIEKLKKRHSGEWIQPFVHFPTPLGGRILDACRYRSILHWAVNPRSPIECYEFKSTIRAKNTYFDDSTQYSKDRYISRTYRFPIIVVHARCWWSSQALNCYRAY